MRFSNSEIKNYLQKARGYQIKVNLSVGEPLEAVPEEVKKSGINAIKNNETKYSPAAGYEELKEKIAQKVLERNSINVSAENVIITHGASGGLTIALSSITKPGDEVFILDPYFLSFPKVAEFLGLEVKFIPLNLDARIDLEKMKANLTDNTKAILLTTPNNPTGLVFGEEDLNKLTTLSEKHGLYIISDEIYEDFVYEDEHFSIGSIYDKTITLFGFSKSYSMTGWRLGYNVASKELIEEMTEVQRYLFYAPSSIAQHGAMVFDQTDISDKIKSFKEKRDYVVANLSKKYELNYKPEGAFYVFPKLPEGVSGDEFCMKALEAGALVFPGSLFSEQDTNFRISYSVGMEELKKGIEILNKLDV